MVSTVTVVASTLGVLMARDVVRAVVLPSSEYAKERVLWLSVLRQAIMDSEGRGEIEQPLIYRAKKWLTKLTYSFLTVCSLAGMSRDQAVYLQEAQRRKLAKGEKLA
jgi:hypothetical protein